ncbi:hypothetical protein [Natronolimnobius sp. AArcel1]|uniref:hypothetical protein n=1 Tax=Natronolimnobius sp. AArcel1 TaxID=1679093 RepID=UPI001F14A090|nr:hypothetical protein [Natronolimnobius sp. AArcel1]
MVKTTEATQLTRAASSLLFPELKFGIGANGTDLSKDFQRVLARIDFGNEFANTGSKAYQFAHGDDISIAVAKEISDELSMCSVYTWQDG